VSEAARNLNRLYLQELEDAPEHTTLGRLRILWWPAYLQAFQQNNAYEVIDRLDVFMDAGREALLQMADEYAEQGAADATPAKKIQLRTQFMKSNTGKMFERFVGLALAHALWELDSDYCIQPFKNDNICNCAGLTRESFKITIRLGVINLTTTIDADLFIFNPEVHADIFLLSIKSTLKDRFHNVPFWNLLRRIAVAPNDFPEISAQSADVLNRAKYVAICSDLALEQPDFGTDAGARELLKCDAALLDSAYVTSSRARGIPVAGRHLGPERAAPFFRLSRFLDYLLTGNNG